jgi:hypothetical protein
MKIGELTVPDLYSAVANALDGEFELNVEISGWTDPSIVSLMVPRGTGVQLPGPQWL